MDFGGEYETIFIPVLSGTSIAIDNDELFPEEPQLTEVTFLRYPEVSSLDERVNRLVQGIQSDIPPEYDHYGYEIRRYMSSVGNVKVYSDEDFLKEQIRNVRKAGVIAKYWIAHLQQEIKDIEQIMESDEDVGFAERTAFRQNKAIIQKFTLILQTWISGNEDLLMLVAGNYGIFFVEYPDVIVYSAKQRREFFNLYITKQTKLKELVAYPAFAFMVY